MTFKKAVKKVPQLAGAYQEGLQALRKSDRDRIMCEDPRRLRGSVDVDGALKAALPNATRWDYGIGRYNGRQEESIWVEVHPASSTHVSDMIRKAQWLKAWLSENAGDLLDMTREQNGFVWLSAGPVALQRNSRQAREIALAGISFPQKHLHLD